MPPTTDRCFFLATEALESSSPILEINKTEFASVKPLRLDRIICCWMSPYYTISMMNVG
jgi:hypothetical protein